MQSTGHASTHAASLVPMQGSAITYAISVLISPVSKNTRCSTLNFNSKSGRCEIAGGGWLGKQERLAANERESTRINSKQDAGNMLVPKASRPATKYQLPFTKYRSPYRHLRAVLIFHDISGHRAGRHRIRTGQIHQAGAAASGEVAVLRADDHLIGSGGNSRTGIDAGTAAWLHHPGPGPDENIQITLLDAVFPSLL